MEEFEAFLRSKKIDPAKFKKGDAARFEEFYQLFQQMHPDSLVAQKLFLINNIRRKFPFKDSEAASAPKKKKQLAPKITPKIKR